MRNTLKTLVLMGLLSGLMLGIGALLGPSWLYVGLGLAVVTNVGAYFFSDRLVLRMQGAREVSSSDEPRLHALVEELCARGGLPKPRVFLIDELQPNAFATGRDPQHGAVAVTTGLLRILDERELRGVLAHELAHIKNRDILVATIAATAASAVTYVAHAAGLLSSMFAPREEGDDEGTSALEALVLALFAPLAATVIQLGISRSREYLADAAGAELAGDSDGLARALEKLEHGAQVIPTHTSPATASLFIVNPLASTERILSLFSTHPRTSERVRRLRGMALRASSPAVLPAT